MPPNKLPTKKFIAILITTLTEPLCLTIFYPYMYYLIRDFGVAPDPNDIGFYAGILAASFSLAQFCTSLFWGLLSDKIGTLLLQSCNKGHKIVLAVGLFGNAITMAAFGFSKTFTIAIITRSLSGALNGNSGVCKSVIAEISDDTNAHLAFGWFNLTWSFGAIFGPIIGGYLYDPVNNLPWLFGDSELLKQYPYLLPPLVSALVSALGFLALIFLFDDSNGYIPIPDLEVVDDMSESHILYTGDHLNNNNSSTDLSNIRKYATISSISSAKTMRLRASVASFVSRENFGSSLSVVRSASVGIHDFAPVVETEARISSSTINAIICYSLLAFGNVIIDEVYNLWAVEPPRRGGIGFTPSDIGLSLSVMGVLDVLFQAFVYCKLQEKFGSVRLFFISTIIYGPSVFSLSFVPLIAQKEGVPFIWVWITLVGLMLIKIIAQICGYSTIMQMINNSATTRNRGLVNGIAQTFAALVRAIGPFVGGLLWSWSLKQTVFPLDYHLCFLAVWVILCGATIISLKLPESLNRRLPTDEVSSLFH